MLIDMQGLTKEKTRFGFNDELSFERSGSTVPVRACAEGTVYKDKTDYILHADVSAVINLPCDSCLSPVEKELRFEIDEVFSENPTDEDAWRLTDAEIQNRAFDIAPAVIAAVVYNMPMRVLCRDDCKGLCPKCGHNLNDGDCGCDRTYRNPQFEVLLDLFKDE